ncbi:hypothetical protein MCAP1_002453 [Malassezia caprae]|uniref:Peregrin n=1 Tax=Malassezia caprae TaxID=1381934 RepID=A0AAF0E8I6_9BASI|nr:hypothetical protein MCAP1_002453 [Malassezia caprae]
MKDPAKQLAAARSGAERLKPSFRHISAEEEEEQAACVHEAQMVQYGYHADTHHELPRHLVRYIEPTEDEFDRQVEYDMDEQDQQWLDALNAERRREQLDVISYEAFEIIMDRCEKEWFQLMKRIPSRLAQGVDDEDYPEDSNCAICNESDCENLNAIVFCDGCNLAVHQECYGIPYIPEGQWLCRKCTVSPDRPVSCVLCPHEGGAFKQTTEGAWAHLLCAMWIPETGVSNAVYMEPIDGVPSIPKARWRLRCYLCNRRSGACIQCEHRSCFTAFHVMCARRAGLLLPPRRRTEEHAGEDAGDVLEAYCHHHLPPKYKAELHARIRGSDDDDDSVSDVSTSEMAVPLQRPGHESLASKSARAYHKLYSSGPLPVPHYLVRRVLEYAARLPIRRKPQTVVQMVRYWSLKRQQMRGAPLLKRLHMEPWTVGHFVGEPTPALTLAKLQYLFRLREDLEKVRLLVDLVRKREKTKLRQGQLFDAVFVQQGLLYRATQLHGALARIEALDKDQWFMHPVSQADVPDYYDVIQHPMTWSQMRAKVDAMAYTSVADWEADVRLVCANAQQYNAPGSVVHRAAAKILQHLPRIAAEAAAACDAEAPRSLEPPARVWQALQAPYEAPAHGESVGAPPADTSTLDAFLHQWYVAHKPVPPPAPRPPRAPKAPKPPTAPTRRSARHAAPAEPEPTTSEPRELASLSSHDSFKYFHVGWLLPLARGAATARARCPAASRVRSGGGPARRPRRETRR